jgi:hypothetical protein
MKHDYFDVYGPRMDGALKKRYHDDYYQWTTFGQTQLEDHGFTSSAPRPVPPSKDTIAKAWTTKWETTRKSGIVSPNLIPFPLHVCQESRSLLRRLGYALFFGTRTQPAMTSLNPSSDILYLQIRRTTSRIQTFFEMIAA